MSSTHNSTHMPDRPLGAFLQVRALLLILLAGALLLGAPAYAQSAEPASTATGSIVGTVVDSTEDPIPDAAVVLHRPTGDRLAAVTKDDGSFAFHGLTAGITYQATVTAEGFAPWNASIAVEPGQENTLSGIKLRILTVQRAVTVSYSEKEVAAQEFKAEEQQRILHFIPNIYVTYEPHPEPLTTEMKFHMAYKSLTDPVFFGRTAALAGIQQAVDTPEQWRQGATGYRKRLGAGFADATTEGLIGNAILPSLLHQDPRYFYQGDGTKKSRALHAILAPFICKGDNGETQPNYSTWGGSLISSSISLAYYPSSDRNAQHVFKNFGVGMGLHIAGGLVQEFILAKFTSKGKH
jgi:hypothetical protein